MNEMQRIKPAPIRKILHVAVAPERAFDVFVGMGLWWLKGHSVIAQLQQTEQVDVVIEPRAGGRWYEVGANGGEYEWGRVVVYDRPGHLVLTWQLGADFTFDPTLRTTVEVRFVTEGAGTRVEFEHRDLEQFGDAAGALRDSMDRGWGDLLDGFGRLAAG